MLHPLAYNLHRAKVGEVMGKKENIFGLVIPTFLLAFLPLSFSVTKLNNISELGACFLFISWTGQYENVLYLHV
jgi:hypothetical protein